MSTRAISIAEPDATFYERDFFGWTEQQAALLRGGDLRRADLAHIAEEIETLGRSERAALESAFRLIALHMLKLQFQPERTSRRWATTATRERLNAARLLRDNPSLKPKRDDLFPSAYADAREEAASETGLPLATFPITPPFSLDTLLDEHFFPRG